jgi:hypothetical protein
MLLAICYSHLTGPVCMTERQQSDGDSVYCDVTQKLSSIIIKATRMSLTLSPKKKYINQLLCTGGFFFTFYINLTGHSVGESSALASLYEGPDFESWVMRPAILTEVFRGFPVLTKRCRDIASNCAIVAFFHIIGNTLYIYIYIYMCVLSFELLTSSCKRNRM